MPIVLSSRDGSQFGSFHFPYGIVEHSMTPEAANLLFREDAEKPAKEPASQEEIKTMVRLAYQASSFLHETRHFYDQFGTVAGISLFSSFMEALKSFAQAAARVAADETKWRWPVAKWSAEKTSPVEIRRFMRQARSFRVGSELLLGTFNGLEVDGHVEDLLGEAVTGRGFPIDVAPIRIAVLGRDSKPLPKTIMHPLGVEALFEANAHALTRNLIGHAFPKVVADELTQDRFVVEYRPGERRDLGPQVLPYMVLDRVITKYLRARGRQTFARATVIGVADEVLAQAFLTIKPVSDTDTTIEASRVGKTVHAVLEQTSLDDLVAGNVPASDLVTQVYRGLLDAYEKGGDWDTVADDGSLLSSIRIWESYSAQHFAVPLLRVRLATDHKAFRSSEGLLDLLKAVWPPIVSTDGQTAFDLPDRVRQAWAQVLMAGQIMQAVAASDTVLCPRAFGTIPGLSNTTFASKYLCTDYIPVGCGRFSGDSVEDTPCLFVNMLRALRLA
jgi:hypothetical protein